MYLFHSIQICKVEAIYVLWNATLSSKYGQIGQYFKEDRIVSPKC